MDDAWMRACMNGAVARATPQYTLCGSCGQVLCVTTAAVMDISMHTDNVLFQHLTPFSAPSLPPTLQLTSSAGQP